LLLVGGLWFAGCSKPQHHIYSTVQDPSAAAQLKQFVAEKKAQADSSTNEAAPGFAPFFADADKGDWLAVSNDFIHLRQHAGQYEGSTKTDDRLHGTRWEAVKEVWGAMEAFSAGDAQCSAAFGRDIVASIPPGSIYFGGTDPGRFVVTAMCRSQVDGDPFFVLTQNALADGTYLDYLQQMYGGKIYTPTREDSQRCFEDYSTDVDERSKHNQLRPGETARSVDGKVQITGQIAVMTINGLIARIVFDKNPSREFYVEESFPLDWMYPYLEPHGLIFKINRQPAATLSDDVIQADHEYWAKCMQPMIGGWLKDDTSVAAVADFATKTFGRHDFSGFQGDRRFIENDYAHKWSSKLRSSIAGVYAWRVEHATDPADKERMARAADFAFRQAWALCPYSPESMYRYVNFLMSQKRIDDAILVAETTAKLPQSKGNDQLKPLVEQLKRMR
jgi:hypothetical protein